MSDMYTGPASGRRLVRGSNFGGHSHGARLALRFVNVWRAESRNAIAKLLLWVVCSVVTVKSVWCVL